MATQSKKGKFTAQCTSTILHHKFNIQEGKLIHPSKVSFSVKNKLLELISMPMNNTNRDKKFCQGCIDYLHPHLTPPSVNHLLAQPTQSDVKSVSTSTDPVVIIDFNQLDCKTFSSLTTDQKSKIVYFIALSENSNLLIDNKNSTVSKHRSLENMLNFNISDYVTYSNTVITGFLTGIMGVAYGTTHDDRNKLCNRIPLQNQMSKAKIYTLCKAIESCLQLTSTVSVMPFHFREVILMYNVTRSKLAIDLLASGSPSGSYQTTRNWLKNLPMQQQSIHEDTDLVVVFDNNQILQRRWNITVGNTTRCNITTMIIMLPFPSDTVLQNDVAFKPDNWMWHLKDEEVNSIKTMDQNNAQVNTKYEKQLHPFLCYILKEVMSEQVKEAGGLFKDHIDDDVEKSKQNQNYKNCQSCDYDLVPKKARKCPNCGNSLSIKTVIDENQTYTVKEKISSKGREVRVSLSTTGSTKLSYQPLTEHGQYGHLEDKNSCTVTPISVCEPVFVNPCSRDAVAIVFREIGKKAGIYRYGGQRKWLVVVCDGLPFVIGVKIIERYYVCSGCDDIIIGLESTEGHSVNEHPNSVVMFSKEFDWLLLVPGPGHIEMNMLRSFVEFTWEVFWEDMCELFNFKSVNAKLSAKKVTDHHKGMTLARISHEAMAKELVLPYVRHSLANDSEVSCEGYLQYITNVQDPNYAFMVEATFDLLDSIFGYRAGIRSGNSDLTFSSRSTFSKLWFARNHPMYQFLECYDTCHTIAMPKEVRDFVDTTLSVNTSGLPYSSEGADFKLEAVNKNVQNLLPANPSGQDWQLICANYNHLQDIRGNTMNDMGIKPSKSSRTLCNISDEVDALRILLREKEYLMHPFERRGHKSLSGKELDERLVFFATDAHDKRERYVNLFLDLYNDDSLLTPGNVPFKEPPIFVTKEERETNEKIENRSISEIKEAIEVKLQTISDNTLKSTLEKEYVSEVIKRKGKKAVKADFINFYRVIEEYIDLYEDELNICDSLPTEEIDINE